MSRHKYTRRIYRFFYHLQGDSDPTDIVVRARGAAAAVAKARKIAPEISFGRCAQCGDQLWHGISYDNYEQYRQAVGLPEHDED